MEVTENKNKNSSIGAVALLAAFASAFAVGWLYFYAQKSAREYADRVAALEAKISELEKTSEENKNAIYRLAVQSIVQEGGVVDFTISTMQSITPGFNVGNLEMKEYLTGVKISGEVVNTEAVAHQSATFSVKIGESEREFTLNYIRSGGSTSFTVYVPDVNPKEVKYGKITFKSSSISYFKPAAP